MNLIALRLNCCIASFSEDSMLAVIFYHFHFQKDNTKSLFIPWKLGLTKWFKYLFCGYVFGSDWCFFQLIVLLRPGFNCWGSFALSWVDKIQLEHKILYLLFQIFLHLCRINNNISWWPCYKRLTFQLINSISRVFQ